MENSSIENKIDRDNEAAVAFHTQQQEQAVELEAALEEAIKAGQRNFDGNIVMRDAKSRYVDIDVVNAQDKLQDEVVRKIMFFAENLNAQIARFKGHSFGDIIDFANLLAQEYKTDIGGEKGNITLTNYDATMRVSIKVADLFDFGPEIEVAKKLFNECMSEWSSDSGPELRTIISKAFNTEGGQYNRAELLSLLRLDITHPKWLLAKRALQDAIRILGTKQYIRFQKRDSPSGKWETVTIDLAKA